MQKIAIVSDRDWRKDLEEINILLNCILQNENYEITTDYTEADEIIVFVPAWGFEKIQGIYVLADVQYNAKENANIIVTGELARRKILLRDTFSEAEILTIEELYTKFGGVPKKLKRYMKQNAVIISQGCRHKCSYCVYPLIENRYTSKTMEQIFSEIKLIEEEEFYIEISGTIETGDYGVDIYGKPMLPELMELICKKYPNCAYGIRNLHPDGITDELIEVMRRNHQILAVEVNIEHVDDLLLKQMNRPTWESTLAKLQKIKRFRQDMKIITTVMVGFPGESDFAQAKLVKALPSIEGTNIVAMQYEKIFGTSAYKLLPQVSEEVVDIRLRELERKYNPITKIVMEESKYPISVVYENAVIEMDYWHTNILTSFARQKHDYIAGTDTDTKIEDGYLAKAEEIAYNIINNVREKVQIDESSDVAQVVYTKEFRELIYDLLELTGEKPALAEKAKRILLEEIDE